MTTRRPLTEGVKPIDRTVEEAFVFTGKKPEPPAKPSPRKPVERLLVSSRIRAELATDLKRASLERQLAGVEPSSLQEILEEAVEAWLTTNGYRP